MAVDLRAVAQRSGVSVSTASRALSGNNRVSAATVAKVRSAANALGYRPNAHARALRTARSQFVGLVVTNLYNASFQTIAHVLQRELSAHGYQLLLTVTGGEIASERAALHTLVEHSAAGVIVVGSDTAATDELRALGMPTVHLARRPLRPTGDCVLGDELAGARMATEHLIGLGHRRIALIAEPAEISSGRERLQGHWLAMQAAALEVRDELTIVCPLTPEAGADAVEQLMALPVRRRPTALLVANHEASYGALPALRERGVAVPDDLSVVCYEDSLFARYWHPAVTVIDNNAEQLGELAAGRLLERIARAGSGPEPANEFRIGSRLIERSSTRRTGRRTIETQTFPA